MEPPLNTETKAARPKYEEKSVMAVYAIGATTTTKAAPAHLDVDRSARNRSGSRARMHSNQRTTISGSSFKGWYVQNPSATATPAVTAAPRDGRSPQRSSAASAAAPTSTVRMFLKPSRDTAIIHIEPAVHAIAMSAGPRPKRRTAT